MRKLWEEDKATIGFYLILIVTSIWDVMARGGEKIPRIILIAGTIFAAKIFFTKTFLKKSRAAYLTTLIFIFFSMYLANVMNFYAIPHYDKILHFFSGIILATFGFIIYANFFGDRSNETVKPMAMVLFLLFFCAGSAALWEIWEFTTDSLFNLMAQNGLEDTMWDIILGTGGGFFVIYPVYLYEKGKDIKILQRIADEMR